MKTITPVFIATALITLLTSGTPAGSTFAQPVTQYVEGTNAAIFERLIAHRQQNDVALQWRMSSNAGVAGFVIERSYNGTYFDYLGEATVSNTSWNRFRDATVTPGYVYYRIIAVMDDGTTITSEVEVIRIVRHG